MTKRPAPAPSTADWASHGRSATCTHAGHVFCPAIYAKGIICARGDAKRGGSRRSTPPPRRNSPRRVRCTSMYARAPSTAPHSLWRLMSTRPYHMAVCCQTSCRVGGEAPLAVVWRAPKSFPQGAFTACFFTCYPCAFARWALTPLHGTL